MPLLVTGSIGIDTVETPFGKRDDVIGGSAVYFSYLLYARAACGRGGGGLPPRNVRRL
jgi:hypothetical protein